MREGAEAWEASRRLQCRPRNTTPDEAKGKAMHSTDTLTAFREQIAASLGLRLAKVLAVLAHKFCDSDKQTPALGSIERVLP